MSYIEWLRGAVGHRKIFLVFSSIVLQDDAGRVLLQRRTDFNFWGLPGGVLELDEDILTCARRELVEETGLKAGELQLTGVYTDPRYDVVYPNGDQAQQCTICFRGQVSGGEMRVDGVETSEQAFFSYDKLTTLSMPVWYQDMIRDALKGPEVAFSAPFSLDAPMKQLDAIRPFVGQSPVIAVGASVLVVGKDGRILGRRRHGESCWRLPAGLSRLGENVAQTAVRCVREQTGLHTIPERIVGVYSNARFHMTLADTGPIKPVGPLLLARPAAGSHQLRSEPQVELAWMQPGQLAESSCAKESYLLKLALHHWQSGHFVC